MMADAELKGLLYKVSFIKFTRMLMISLNLSVTIVDKRVTKASIWLLLYVFTDHVDFSFDIIFEVHLDCKSLDS